MRLSRLLACSLWCWAALAGAADFVLIGADDLQREQEYLATLSREQIDPPPRATRSLFPAIRVLAPEVDTTRLKAPLRMQLAFVTSSDAHILPQTFRALYGMLKLDITETLRRHAQLDEKGLLAEGAGLPPGAHRIFVQVADDRGRVTERELRFRVGD